MININKKYAKLSIFALRVSLGWIMFYAGITKILDPSWSAVGYIKSAKTFPAFYSWITEPYLINWVNLLNEWGLTLLGIALILGIFTRLSAVLGSLLMFMYYLVALDFPRAGAHSFIIDEHIIYILALILLANVQAGKIWGLEKL